MTEKTPDNGSAAQWNHGKPAPQQKPNQGNRNGNSVVCQEKDTRVVLHTQNAPEGNAKKDKKDKDRPTTTARNRPASNQNQSKLASHPPPRAKQGNKNETMTNKNTSTKSMDGKPLAGYFYFFFIEYFDSV